MNSGCMFLLFKSGQICSVWENSVPNHMILRQQALVCEKFINALQSPVLEYAR